MTILDFLGQAASKVFFEFFSHFWHSGLSDHEPGAPTFHPAELFTHFRPKFHKENSQRFIRSPQDCLGSRAIKIYIRNCGERSNCKQFKYSYKPLFHPFLQGPFLARLLFLRKSKKGSLTDFSMNRPPNRCA